jgi:hypothetical protein
MKFISTLTVILLISSVSTIALAEPDSQKNQNSKAKPNTLFLVSCPAGLSGIKHWEDKSDNNWTAVLKGGWTNIKLYNISYPIGTFNLVPTGANLSLEKNQLRMICQYGYRDKDNKNRIEFSYLNIEGYSYEDCKISGTIMTCE